MYYSTRYSQVSKRHRHAPLACVVFVLSCINDLIDMSNNTANILYQILTCTSVVTFCVDSKHVAAYIIISKCMMHLANMNINPLQIYNASVYKVNTVSKMLTHQNTTDTESLIILYAVAPADR